MEDVQIERETLRMERSELKQIQENVWRTINSLELCWLCQRICICKGWLIHKATRWICGECLP